MIMVVVVMMMMMMRESDWSRHGKISPNISFVMDDRNVVVRFPAAVGMFSCRNHSEQH